MELEPSSERYAAALLHKFPPQSHLALTIWLYNNSNDNKNNFRCEIMCVRAHPGGAASCQLIGNLR